MIRAAAVARGNEVAAARILARTLAEHHPEWRLSVLVLPGVRPTLHQEEPFEVLSPADLAPRGDALPAGAPVALRAALARPLVALRGLEAGADAVVVLPPDAEVRGPLDAIEAALADHAGVLVPRVLGELPADGEHPDPRDLLEAGEIDDELVGVRADDAGRALLEWWEERAREAAEAAASFGDDAPAALARLGASPLAAALTAFGDVARLDDPAYDLSYWNLHERDLTGARLIRFKGFRADRPWWLSEHGSRTLVLDDPELAEACGARARALLESGWVLEAEGAGTGRELPNGLVWNDRLRRLHAQAVDAGEDFGDIYGPDGARAFAAWLSEPAELGAAAGVTRYGLDVWRERRDVRDVFPDLDRADGEGFVAWLWQHGRRELDLEESLLPPRPASVELEAEHVPPVLVTGYLRGNLGLGEAARGYTAALQAAGVPVATATLVPDSPGEKERAFEEIAMPDGREPEVNLLAVNAYLVPEFAREAGEEALRERYTIGQWAWETDRIPPEWDPAFDLVDELWVYSRYVAENLARATDVDVPVVVVPLPVTAPDAGAATVPFELPDGFVFLFAFDFLSTLQRKNPLGLIRAFEQAFEPGEGPVLLLKTINAGYRPQERERLRHAIGGREDIRIVDATLEPDQMAALFARADCYVSLHRAEGYGLTLAESMALGKPVIGTGFSGNTDFMTPANSYLVDWQLTEVGPDAEHYPAEGTWAEPSVEHAAALMREVWQDQAAARARGARAAADVAAALSPAAVGAIARGRLVRIAHRRPAPAPAAPEAPVAVAAPELDDRLAFDLGGGDGGAGPRALARRTLFRALRPYTASERKLDEALADAVRRLTIELERDRATRARDLARSARAESRISKLKDLAAELTRAQEDLRGRIELQERSVLGIAKLEDVAAELTRAQEDLGGRIELQERILGEIEPAARELIAGARARPLMAGDGLAAFDHDVAGRVLGFRSGAGAPLPEEEVYRRFEDVFRGSRERVSELIEPYVELLAGHGPVLDVGSGRGELIERLAAAGVEARGVDSDAGMAAQAQAQGLDVVVGDGIEHLAGLEDGALGAITAIHVIEHLPADALVRFFELARAKLRPDGLLVAETVNPHAVHALKTFWVDPTHQHPVFPEVALTLAEAAGFREGFLWHPRGTRDAERDLFREDAYAVVAVS